MSCEAHWSERIRSALTEGGLEAASWRALRAHLAGCAACRERWDLESRAVAALEGHAGPPEALVEPLFDDLFEALAAEGAVPTAAPQATVLQGDFSRRRRGWVTATLALAAALTVAVLVPRGPETPEGPTARGGGSEGGGLRAFCIRVGADGPTVDAHTTSGSDHPARCALADRLQFTYSLWNTKLHYLTILGVGPQGEVTWYWPRGEAHALEAGRDLPLPGSFDLSVRHARGRHRLYGVFSETPLPHAPVETVLGLASRLQATPPRALPPIGEVTTLWLEIP